MFASLFGTRKLADAVQAQTVILQALSERLERAQQNGGIVTALERSAEQVSVLGRNLQSLSSCPLPVQTFPTVDNVTWEGEKKNLAKVVNLAFARLHTNGLRELGSAHKAVERNLEAFFAALMAYGRKVDRSKAGTLMEALDTLLNCSPKRIVANFQQLALEIGWAFVASHNQIIDLLAQEYPRCRGGIFGARLNYADVLQISEEVLATLRCTSTVLDDMQRRYDLLEALEGELRADLESAEINKIFEALKGTASDSLRFGEDDGFLVRCLKFRYSLAAALTLPVLSLLSVPSAQFQGQLNREQRIRLFVATAALVRQGWGEWSKLNETIVRPNIEVLFELKSNFVANRLVALSDLITANGYSLQGLAEKITATLESRHPKPKQHHAPDLRNNSGKPYDRLHA